MRTSPIATFAILAVLFISAVASATRYHQYTEQFGDPEDGAEVLAATYFGGKGNEWLTGGAFAPDGTIVLVGNVTGPDLAIPGVTFKVYGKDTPEPSQVELKPEVDKKGVQKKDKNGELRWLKPSWKDSSVTGFVLRCSPDLKTVLSAHRFPWEGGTITDCRVGKDGTIYICGKATTLTSSAHPAIKKIAKPEVGAEKGAIEQSFIARLTSDANSISWLLHADGFSNAPTLDWAKDGAITFTSQDVKKISTDGKVLSSIEVNGSLGHLTAVNPSDGSYVRGGEHHWRTGREPWRCPTLNVYNSDGSHRYQLYDWGGPYVGLDGLRLVSDTAVRRVEFAPDGDLMVYLWSDGGNSVALREPMDVRRFAPKVRGLNFSAWGAGVLSCGYLVKIDPTTWRATGGTLWLAYLEDKEKPNSAWIESLGHLPDGSVAFAGRAASSVIQTKNRLSPAQSGQHAVILNDDLSHIRFSSTLPGTGAVYTGNGHKEAWSIVSAPIQGGKQRVLFLGSSSGIDKEFETPTVNARQDAFGGGWSDGYALLLELDENPLTPPEEADQADEKVTTPWEFAETAEVPSFLDKKGKGPEAGQLFRFQPETPKYVTVDAEFRSEDKTVWPSFFYGRPASGQFEFDPTSSKGSFALELDTACQPKGDQSRRVLGEIIQEDPKADLGVRFEILSIGPMQGRRETRMEKGKSKSRTVAFATAEAILHLAGRQIKVKPELQFDFSVPRNSTVADRVQINATLTTTAEHLGLAAPSAKAAPIHVRISGNGFAE